MSSNKGESAYIAAVAERLKKQSEGMQSMMADMQSLLDRTDNATPNAGVEQALSAIESTLADVVLGLESDRMAKAIEALGEALGNLSPVVNVPAAAAPVVTVQVSPTPIIFKPVMPEQAPPVVNFTAPDTKGATWQITIPGQFGAPSRTMTITRTN